MAVKNGKGTVFNTAIEAQQEQWHGRAVMDTVTNTEAKQSQFNTAHMIAASHDVADVQHRGKSWSGA